MEGSGRRPVPPDTESPAPPATAMGSFYLQRCRCRGHRHLRIHLGSDVDGATRRAVPLRLPGMWGPFELRVFLRASKSGREGHGNRRSGRDRGDRRRCKSVGALVGAPTAKTPRLRIGVVRAAGSWFVGQWMPFPIGHIDYAIQIWVATELVGEPLIADPPAPAFDASFAKEGTKFEKKTLHDDLHQHDRAVCRSMASAAGKASPADSHQPTRLWKTSYQTGRGPSLGSCMPVSQATVDDPKAAPSGGANWCHAPTFAQALNRWRRLWAYPKSSGMSSQARLWAAILAITVTKRRVFTACL